MLAAGANGPYDLDPIRVMKGCFVVSQAGRSEWRSLFDFAPYDYGPFDTSVYRARDALLAKRYLQADNTGRYGSYTLTDSGTERVRQIEQQLDDRAIAWLRSVGHYVCAKSFVGLLDDIYARFPEYATRSVMKWP